MNNYILGFLLLQAYLIGSSNHWYLNEIGNENENEHHHSGHVRFVLDIENFNTELTRAPLTSVSKRSTVIMDFPTPDGKMIQFEMFESPVMPELLSQKYPMIRTFTGRGIENPNDRVSVTLNGENAKILLQSKLGNVFIDRMRDGHYRISYDEYGVNAEDVQNHISSCTCGIEMSPPEIQNYDTRDFPYCVGGDEPCFEIGNKLVTFRYAAILTAEANNEVADGTVAGGLAWIAAMANQVNLVWIRELSFRLELAENSDLIIYTDENPTPEDFTDYDMYVELERVMSHLESVIGPGGYMTPQADLVWEYGAVFNAWYGGGLAYVPGSTSANLPSYAVHIHEIGHNLGSSHNCTYEGGWASTFGGTAMCNRTSTLPGSYGDQYSSHTIDIAIRYQNEPYWLPHYYYQLGFSQEETENEIPELFVPESGFYIPKDTPFKLEGYAIDSDSENLTYAWEQNDASDYGWSPPDFPADSGPLFCSIDAKTDGNVRYFPYMESLLANYYSTGSLEQLPFASREINMRLQVRDNDVYSGAYNYKNVSFNVDGNAGPFRVSSQSENETWTVGDSYLVEWDVAGTDEPSTVNCQSVDIFMAVNGSENFDHVLAENVPNNGSHEITVPSLPSVDNCRVMVKSADNIFFDINNGSISIQNNNLPEVSMDQSSIDLIVPIDSPVSIERDITNSGESGSILMYDALTAIDYEGEGYLSFDGIDDNVNLGANILSGNGDFTISLWVRTASTNNVIIQQRNGGFNGEYQVGFNGNGQIHFWSYSDGYRWSATSPGVINDNSWHHIAVVQDGAIDGGRIYVDGNEEAVNEGGGVVNLSGSIHTFLGADMRDYVLFLTGDINDVNIYTSALTASEIAFLYDQGFGFNTVYDQGEYQNSGSLIASYQMLNMTSDILTDISENGHDGNIDGASWVGDLIPIPDWLAVSSEYSWLNVGETESYTIDVDPSELLEDQNYTGKVIFLSNASNGVIEVPVSISIGDDNLEGDINLDGEVNVVDVILAVNMILSGEFSPNADINSDEIVDILDIVILVNIILDN